MATYGEPAAAVRRLEGKVAIITGAGQGMGRALAAGFAVEGASVVVADIDAEAAAMVRDEIEGGGGAALAAEADVSSADQVKQMVKAAVSRFGRIDILVNNAGVRHLGGFLEHSEESWRHSLDVDLTGCFLCMHAVVPVMIENGGGSIINTASIAGLVGRPGRVAYCAAKFGVVGLTMAAAFDLGVHGIRVNALAPGLIDTPMNATYTANPSVAQLGAAETAVGRWGDPADVTQAAIFLASGAAGYITGVTLPVDGGWLAARKRAYE